MTGSLDGMQRPMLASALTALLSCSIAHSATAAAVVKRGLPPHGSAPSSMRALEQSRSHAPVLVEVDRAHAGYAAPVLRRAGGRLVSRRLHIWQLPLGPARRLLPRLLRARAVIRLERVHRLLPAAGPVFSDPLVSTEWWRTAIGADAVTPPGPGIPITVLDSGLDVTHPEFAGRPNVRLLNGQVLTDSPEDFHGTAVASVAAAPANSQGIVGIYPTAAVQAWDARGLTNAEVIAGILAAADKGPSVINMSFGSPENDPMLEQAILAAFGEGSLLVAAAGNELANGNPLLFPASLPHVLTVAASDQQERPTSFSSASVAVDLAAPGQDIVAAIPLSFDSRGWRPVSGTSFAAPIVSAASAWVWSARRMLDNTQVFDLVRFSARDISDPGFDPSTGYGLLDLPAALSRRAPATDGQEPNDDIELVKPNGVFTEGTDPLTRPGHGSGHVRARLDATEDPEDVYRVWVPARRTIRVSVAGNENVELELWGPATKTVSEQGPAKQRDLVAESIKAGTAADAVAGRNSGAHGTYFYVEVFLGKWVGAASYALKIKTARK